ncbi:MAG: hypothetical protein ACLP2P_08755 [Desulfobaccales bacterium]|jgi:hypothetical protein
MKTFRGYVVALGIPIAVVLGIAWFYKGGEHFKNVALICYGFVIGWLSAAFVFKRQ